jgi:hypothetical protein
MMSTWCRLLTLCAIAAATQAVETVTRGPYLQMATPTSMTVRWRTDVAGSTRGTYGTTQGSLTSAATGAASTTEHEVALTGLTPATTYYYAVGTSTTVLAGDATYRFTTPPAAGSSGPTRLWVLGDAGTGDANQAAVRNAFYTWNSNKKDCSAMLFLGDNAYNSGLDTEFQTNMFNVYAETLRQTVFWSTIGNHETNQATNPALTIPYFQIITHPTGGECGGLASGTEKYYSANLADIHLVCLDSMTSSRAAGSAMLTWLAADLAANTRTWTIAFWHHPPYTKGSHNSDTEIELIEMRQNVLPILDQYGVDLVLSGHSHSYERSYLLDGHYGLSGTLTAGMKKDASNGAPSGGGYKVNAGANHGIVYTVPGSAGKISGGTLNHPAHVVSQNVLGSMAIDISGHQLDATFITSTGTIGDSFRIVKNTRPVISTAPHAGAPVIALP